MQTEDRELFEELWNQYDENKDGVLQKKEAKKLIIDLL